MEAEITSIQVGGRRFLSLIYQYGLFIVFGIMIIFFSTRNPNFFTAKNAMVILQQAAPLGIAAVGMTFVLVTAGIDISIGQNMYLSAVLVGMAMEAMTPSGFLGSFGSYVIIYAIALLAGGSVGALNGLVISRFKFIPLLTSLATMAMARGVGLIVSKSKSYFVDKLGPISNGSTGGIPYVVIIVIVLAIVFQYFLRRTPFGRHLMAIGNDPIAAEKVGINVARGVFWVYFICGMLSGIAGALSAGQVGSVAIYFADGNEFLVISAVVIGGTSLFGGKGSVLPGALIGIILVTTMVNGMTMMNASPYAYRIVRGAIIFAAVMVDSINYKGELR